MGQATANVAQICSILFVSQERVQFETRSRPYQEVARISLSPDVGVRPVVAQDSLLLSERHSYAHMLADCYQMSWCMKQPRLTSYTESIHSLRGHVCQSI
jgi:hypothetical protein